MIQVKKTICKISILVLLLFTATAGFSQSQNNELQTPSTNAEQILKQKFPEANHVKWAKFTGEKKEYMADFTIDKIHMRAYFDKSGNWIETEKEIFSKELPERVMLSIRTQYPNEKILKAFEIEKGQKTMLYEVVLKTESEKTSLIVSRDGYFTSR